ncbi:cAMP-dependent protein kinase type, putative [Entamoeba invadens IP1]|uniref:cAMP-dependent protein kinase type, putative n=1 Tax=Entamoeba invadens IP1 TaxID=370355 RepID=A0A0A1UBN6_ENTIV|nr:cAMP-dependent protein kinase type, putative [Entamoeba invadens IP1]ELP89645.1 cAMP-dependent protein kinase type, putative [Entamoeba invadens IP1]|eukprot:XP_004256416.1 cAMP-dependent protein kinase type, putative [Entamoeba invadens IP1]
MLDKFRSDYIVHFYGAVFIPTKYSMVTEFAQFGSLQDLITKQTNLNTPSIQFRRKVCLDAIRGLQYLHFNDVLHRDIKPDNILIFSMDPTEKVNGKLTDFGSARNVNLLMTNMTFTKGIGTPKYMAPEVLNREKYEKPSDIFSLSITMYETFGWKLAYMKTDKRFQYALNIADFVTEGKRLEKLEDVDSRINNIINRAWDQNKKARLTIEQVLKELESI